jgi:hypothetical protein
VKLILLLGIVFCSGGVASQLMAIAVAYRARMRRQKFEALRQRIIGNRYCGKIDIEVGGRYFEK